MTYEELKEEARRQGYMLRKEESKVRLIPCVCGCNRRTTWYEPNGMFYECKICTLRSPAGRSEREARKNWNKYIEGLKEAAE